MKFDIENWIESNLDRGELTVMDQGLGINTTCEIISECFVYLLKDIEIDLIRSLAKMECPVSGYVIQNEESRKQMNDWADVLEKIKGNDSEI